MLDEVAGGGTGRRAVPVPRTRRDRPGSRPATTRRDRTAPGERPSDRHSAAIWSMRATRCFRSGGGHARSVSVGPPPIPPTPAPGMEMPAAAMVLVGDSVPPMDIDEFYEADPRRRASAELELGSEWLGKDGVQHELNYVEDTGELYVLREPAPHVREDPFGGVARHGPAGVREQDHRARHSQDRLGRRAAHDPRGLARGDARTGQSGHPLARAAAGRGRRRRGADGGPHFGQTRSAAPGRASWPGAGSRCCWWPCPRRPPCRPGRRRGRRAGT